MYRLFVYGILKDRFDGIPATITAECYNFGPYPAITELGQGWEVNGKIIEVSEEILAELDLIEGVPTLYQRQPYKIGDINVEIYVYVDKKYADKFPKCYDFKI